MLDPEGSPVRHTTSHSQQSTTDTTDHDGITFSTPLPSVPNYININSNSKRPRSSSPLISGPGSPTGSSPKRAMSEDDFHDRDRQGVLSVGAGNSGLGMGNDGEQEDEVMINGHDGNLNGQGPRATDLLRDEEMIKTGAESEGYDESMIDPELLKDNLGNQVPKGLGLASGNGMDVDGEDRGAIKAKPSVEDVIKLIRESSERPLHPDKPIYILPSTFITHLLSSPDHTSLPDIYLDTTSLIDQDLYDSGGKLCETRFVKGSSGGDGGWRVKDGLKEFDWESLGKGSNEVKQEEGGKEGQEIVPDMIFVEESCWTQLLVLGKGAEHPEAFPRSGIKRHIQSDPMTGFLSIEINPPTFIIHEAYPSSSSSAISTTQSSSPTLPIRIVVPAGSQVSDLHSAAIEAIKLDKAQSAGLGSGLGEVVPGDDQPSRLWRLELDPSVVGKAQIDDGVIDAALARAAGIDEDYDAPEQVGPPPPKVDLLDNESTPSSTLMIPSHLLPVCSAKLIYTYPLAPGQADPDLAEALIEHTDVFAIEMGTRGADGKVTWMVGVNEAGMAQELNAATDPGSESTIPEVNMQSPLEEEEKKVLPLFSGGLAYTGTHKEPTVESRAESSKMGAATATAGSGGVTTRSKTEGAKEKATVRGLKGLNNLGNTCFMNSALQCLSNTEELNRYILSGLYKQEINRGNPLGMGGRVADAFGGLIEDLWNPNATKSSGFGYFGSSSSVAPREVKSIVGRFAPQFQGYGQQDTQELLAFLLDGLHEDLNRIDKKPYVEKPDWKDGGGDEELALFGKKNWDGYKMRNDSVIVDLFQGQLKSTLTCPVCTKASITLDPFMYLTVPLPIKTNKSRVVYVVPLGADRQRMKVTVQYSGGTTIAGLKKKLGEMLDLPGKNLLITDEFSGYIYGYWKDGDSAGEPKDSDRVVFHEMPRAVQQTHKTIGFAEEAPQISIPVYTRMQNGGSKEFPVFFIHLSLADTKSFSAIKRAIANGYRSLVDHDMEDELFISASSAAATSDATGEVTQNVTDMHLTDEKSTPPEHKIARVSSKSSISSSLHLQPGDPRRDLYEIKISGPTESYRFMNSSKGFYSGDTNKALSIQEWVTKKKGMVGRVFSAMSRHGTPDEDSEAASVQLLEHGDLIFVEWRPAAAKSFLGSDMRGRYRDESVFLVHEDPSVQTERKKAELIRKKGITLDDCLEEFSREETLGDNDLWYCPHCKEHRAATKRMEIYEVPDILVIALKRFGSRGSGKINASVEFPVTGFDLESRTQSRQVGKALEAQGKNPEDYGIPPMDEPLIYDLYAVDNHFGGLGGGHYTAHAKNQDDGKWYYFDDSSVRETGPEDLNGSSAYLLFYSRRSKRLRGGATALKVVEAESAASSMILDPALNPNLPPRPDPFTQLGGGSPSTSNTTSSPSSNIMNDLSGDDESMDRGARERNVFAWDRDANAGRSSSSQRPPGYSATDDEGIDGYSTHYDDNFVSIDAEEHAAPTPSYTDYEDGNIANGEVHLD